MKRLFYLVDRIDNVENISEDLHSHGITDWRFHILSRDTAGVFTRKLHGASILDKTDIVRWVERGALIGGGIAVAIMVLGMVSGLFSLPGSAWLALVAFGVFAGGGIAGFGGITAENYRIRPFHDALERGDHLVMVDVYDKDEAEMKRLMEKNHPEARLQGEDSAFNNPFSVTRLRSRQPVDTGGPR